ncbi:hypothetical protein [Alkaliphilus transvaalensis]|uniref:hypothetical protein n=1 Tax=Alkaliphilus transvaalensis TaxID=114628 RepID=UPI0004790187|nr:hypothetical protein [Alkaliphilus transvaalensis]
MHTSAIKNIKTYENGKIGVSYLITEVYKDDWRDTKDYDEYHIRYNEYNYVNEIDFYSMYIENSEVELEKCFISDFSLEYISKLVENTEYNDDYKLLNIELRNCYLVAKKFSVFKDFKIKKVVFNRCIFDILRIDLINLIMDTNSQFEFYDCKFINTQISFEDFIMDNAHFVISNCEF